MPTSKLRIGVLTFHRCVNYGSYWQARSLVEGLRRLGHEASLLDHSSPRVDRAELRCALQPRLPLRSSRQETMLYARKVRKFRDEVEALPLSPRFPLDQPELLDPYDLVIVGSDEVWNFSHPWYGGWPLFFGGGVPARRIVSYAASFGNYDAQAGLHPHWAGQLARFAALSVRDDNSRRLLREALGEEPALVLDPCLQFPPELPASGPEGERDGREDGPFAVVYGHSFSDRFARMARDWAEVRGLRLLSVGYRNDWSHTHRIEAGPIEFALLVARSAAVVTNFFHGCVFALLHAKPFACVGSSYRMNKLRDLTCAVGAQSHLVDEATTPGQFSDLLDEPISGQIDAAIADLRRQSDGYLQSVLN